MCNTNEALDNIAVLLGYIEEVGFDKGVSLSTWREGE